MKANGQTLNRASYPDLFDVCGIIHGKYFDPIDVNVSTNTISLINHGFTTGQQVQFDTLITLPAGLVVNTNYYFRAVTVNTFTVHNTSGDAGTGANPVDITTQGNGRSFVELFDKFRIPDARGYFLRGWADDSDFDLNRSIGSVQVDLVRLHSHQLIMRNGLAQSNPNLDMYGQSPRSLLNFGALTSVYDVPGDFGTNYNHTTNTGGDETRPTNKAYLVCIKY